MITIFSKEEEKYFLTFVLKYNNGATFENPLDSTKDFYLAVSEDGGNEVDWCIAVTHEEDLLPVVNKFLNDLEEDLDFKKYANKNELNLS